jgi:hypothetical protein
VAGGWRWPQVADLVFCLFDSWMLVLLLSLSRSWLPLVSRGRKATWKAIFNVARLGL